MSEDAKLDEDWGDTAPGEASLQGHDPESGVRRYLLGLALALLLTAASFYIAGGHLVWGPAIPVALIVLALAQMGVHLVFFLHITTGPDNTNNVLALAFGVLIVGLILLGSIWIMGHLNQLMMQMNPARMM
jgi:cytochrome o ubiquinol oxidase operon protein cyoD